MQPLCSSFLERNRKLPLVCQEADGREFLLSYTAVGEMMTWLLSEVDFRAKHEAGLSFSWVVVVALDGFLHQRADRH